MKRAFLFGFALAGILLGCGQSSKGPAAADSTRIAGREALKKPASPLLQEDWPSPVPLSATRTP